LTSSIALTLEKLIDNLLMKHVSGLSVPWPSGLVLVIISVFPLSIGHVYEGAQYFFLPLLTCLGRLYVVIINLACSFNLVSSGRSLGSLVPLAGIGIPCWSLMHQCSGGQVTYIYTYIVVHACNNETYQAKN
jgi:hypothetical protein